MSTSSKYVQLDINKPRWDQSTYIGRAKHFFNLTNPLNIFASNAELERSHEIISKYKTGESLEKLKITEDELWKNKYLYDSAYHPDTGEKMVLIGRMSAQVPMNMVITGCMMMFYKSTPAVIFWQWCNQSFNAVVNYTNRSGANPIAIETLAQSYVSAVGGAVVTALSLNRLARYAPPLAGRLVPLAAVAAANCVNIPLMRITEIKNGIDLHNEEGKRVGASKKAAREAITSVILSRVLMSAPSMVTVPVLTNFIERRNLLTKSRWIMAPLQLAVCGICLTFATPLCCALFAQQVPISIDNLEDEVKDEIRKVDPTAKILVYNKGL